MPRDQVTQTDEIQSQWGLLQTFKAFGGPVAIATGIAFAYAYRADSEYFRMLGAPWVVSMLSPSAILSRYVSILFSMTFLSLMFIYQAMNGMSERKSVYISSGCAILGVIFLGVSSYYSPGPWGRTASGISTLCLLVAAAAYFGELAVQHRLKRSVLHPNVASSLMVGALVVFNMLPNFTAESTVAWHVDPLLSPLPIVKLDTPSSSQWRLVTAVGEKFLIMRPATKRSEREFRLVTTDAIISISPRE